MRFSALSFLLVAVCIYFVLAQGSYEDCCLRYAKSVPKRMRHMVVTYREQKTDGECNIPAIVFTLRRGRVFCADPKQDWAQDLIRRVNRKFQNRSKRRG
ncbi:hypothetical protein AGOR_G00244010 [Albula goreensis]|uniref:C-C motif chemokine n=1 Tax=Albula goreensis TaxID=1534307 RepID=A0A8T3CEF3_9TELE|nr:hypothetical protein AGOR_G00244010 [Albula goreensis]